MNLFPLERRKAQIEHVAERLCRARSDRAADRYAGRVAGGLFAELAGLGLDEAAQDEAVGAFFFEVEQATLARRAAEPAVAEIIMLR